MCLRRSRWKVPRNKAGSAAQILFGHPRAVPLQGDGAQALSQGNPAGKPPQDDLFSGDGVVEFQILGMQEAVVFVSRAVRIVHCRNCSWIAGAIAYSPDALAGTYLSWRTTWTWIVLPLSSVTCNGPSVFGFTSSTRTLRGELGLPEVDDL